MSKGWQIAIITTLVIIPLGTWAGLGIYALTQVCYQMAGFTLMGVDSQTVDFKVGVRAYNPSFLEVEIKGYDIMVFLNNNPIARLQSEGAHTLAAKGVSVLTIPVSFNYKNATDKKMATELFAFFVAQQYDKIVLKMKGKFKGTLMMVPISMKIDFDYTLSDIIKMMKEPATPCPQLDKKKVA